MAEKKEKAEETYKQFIENRNDQLRQPTTEKLLADKVVSAEHIPPGAIPPRPFGTKNNQKLAADKSKEAMRPEMGEVLSLKFNKWADEKKKNKSVGKDSLTPSQDKANAMLDNFKEKNNNVNLTPNYSSVTEGKNDGPKDNDKKPEIDLEPE